MGSLAYADGEFCLRVDIKCQTCVAKAIQVCQCILGVYSATWDEKDKLLRLAGEVDPNVVLKQLFVAGVHAELANFNLKHPHLRHQSHTSYAPSYGGGYNMMPLPYRDPYHPYYLTNDQYHPYGMQRIAAPQIPQIEYTCPPNNTLALPSPLPVATYVPSNPYKEPLNPYQEHDPYGNYHEGMAGCSIM